MLFLNTKEIKRHWLCAINRVLAWGSHCLNIHEHLNVVAVKCGTVSAYPLPSCVFVGAAQGWGKFRWDKEEQKQGDDTRVKLKVLVQRIGAACFGIATDVKCDLSVTLTYCQQCLPPLHTSPAVAMWSQRAQEWDLEPVITTGRVSALWLCHQFYQWRLTVHQKNK